MTDSVTRSLRPVMVLIGEQFFKLRLDCHKSQSVQDMMNSGRLFLPFYDEEDECLMINKQVIKMISEIH